MIRIYGDVFDIASRLKEIDGRYAVYYNTKKRSYELYTEERGRVSYQLTLPFDRLDARSIEYCLATRRERARRLLDELDEQNRELEKRQLYDAKRQAEISLERRLSKEGGL